MKRATALAMALILVMLGSLPACAAETALMKAGGVELRLLEVYISQSTDYPTITLKLRGINSTAHRVWVDLEEVTVDGVPVVSTTRSIDANADTGAASPLLYSVWANAEDGGAGARAIQNGKKLEMLVRVQDGETYKELAAERVGVRLTASGGSSSGSYTPASTDYRTLKQGNKGQDVRDLQQRLLELGYLHDKVDGAFGKKTAAAVMSFCSQHGLYIQGDATPEMQARLYSSSAEIYVEPRVPLVIGPRYNWKETRISRGASMNFRVQVVNRSLTRAVRGFELYYYWTDVWGKHYSNEYGEVTMRQTMAKKVQPGDVVYSDYIYIYPATAAYTVWVGVARIIFEDGEIREVDDVDYYSCDIQG